MKSIIKTDFSRAFINWKFPLAILLMFLVWDLNSKRFGLREDVLFYFINVWGRSITYLMAILISTIPFLSAHIEEKENHFLRYAILRTGVWKYVCSKLIVCFISFNKTVTKAKKRYKNMESQGQAFHGKQRYFKGQ